MMDMSKAFDTTRHSLPTATLMCMISIKIYYNFSIVTWVTDGTEQK